MPSGEWQGGHTKPREWVWGVMHRTEHAKGARKVPGRHGRHGIRVGMVPSARAQLYARPLLAGINFLLLGLGHGSCGGSSRP